MDDKSNEFVFGFQIINSMGQEVYNLKNIEKNFNGKVIDVSTFAKGLYFVVINTDKKNYSIKFTKQ